MSKTNIKVSKKVKESVGSHTDSILNLTDQLKKYITKHVENPNSLINDISISMFLAFSEAFAQDGDSSTNGLNMLSKMLDKIKILMKEYDDLVPEEDADFDLEDDDVSDMQTSLDDDTSDDSIEDLDDEEDSEDKELDMDEEDEDDEEEEDDVI